ncbi:MAG: hypothetical protein H7Z17_04985, partial [Fuerstia sp.]|nr:hypothetical protein [Fuerstiella sp.]
MTQRCPIDEHTQDSNGLLKVEEEFPTTLGFEGVDYTGILLSEHHADPKSLAERYRRAIRPLRQFGLSNHFGCLRTRFMLPSDSSGLLTYSAVAKGTNTMTKLWIVAACVFVSVLFLPRAFAQAPVRPESPMQHAYIDDDDQRPLADLRFDVEPKQPQNLKITV